MKINPKIEAYRFLHGAWGSKEGDDFGAFRVPGPEGVDLLIIASPGDSLEEVPFEHVSVSTKTRCPHWKEMCFVKDLFWDPEEMVMQLHPPQSQWVNNHPYCLHLWKPVKQEIPAPPGIAVGFREFNL